LEFKVEELMGQCVSCCSVGQWEPGQWEPYVSLWQNLALALSDIVASFVLFMFCFCFSWNSKPSHINQEFFFV